jgi:hypothetical protein
MLRDANSRGPLPQDPPTLWIGNEGARVQVPHEPNKEFVRYPSRTTRDTGKWALVDAPDAKDHGFIYIDCTHTDSTGRRWNDW